MAKLLVTADLHLTANHRDEYRFGLFDWLVKQATAQRVDAIAILGDITDKKDRHPATLVNRIVREFTKLANLGIPIIVVRGNHDYIDEDHTYFEFLKTIPGVVVATKRRYYKIDDVWAYLIPHTRNWSFPARDDIDRDGLHYVFLHQTFNGAIASNGARLQGVAATSVPKVDDVLYLSGDIHVPQKIAHIEYVGSPYAIRFGDSYDAHVVLVDGLTISYLTYPAPKKAVLSIRDPDELGKMQGVNAGDQIKIRVLLKKESFIDWRKYRAEITDICKDRGFELHAIELYEAPRRRRMGLSDGDDVKTDTTKRKTFAQTIQGYCDQNGVDYSLCKLGKRLFKAANAGDV